MRWAVAFLIGYLCGSVPVAVLVADRAGVDIRAVGDRNPGYWNVKQQLGVRRALPVLIGDTAKGVVAGAAGTLLVIDGLWGIKWVAVAGAMVGHAWPLFARFRGGKSLLAFVGGMLVITPLPALCGVGVLTVVSLVTRSFSWGVRVAVFLFPFVEAVFDSANRVAATGALMLIIALRFALTAAGGLRRRAPSEPPPFPAAT
jgi:glycerol-3-phosphate acyltransferase PlsY